MKTIITPTDVYNLAFSVEENYNVSVVKESDIAIAESRYLLPIVGETIYSKLVNGGYYDLRVEYVAPMLSAWVRYMIEPLLAERCGLGHDTTTVDSRVLAHLKMMAMEQTRRMSNYLDKHHDEYPEYNSIDNPLNHCSIDGNIVQIY
ncbi:MAG: hypothetical protein J6V55_02955 [Alistipes sp.]|nr:hypothetical protein [Alistipes sp.]